MTAELELRLSQLIGDVSDLTNALHEAIRNETNHLNHMRTIAADLDAAISRADDRR